MTKRIAHCGLLIALAFVFSYLEAILPVPLGIPGIKLGIANLVVVTALYLTDLPTAILISVVRILLVSFTFSAPSTLLFSLSGGVLSLFVMALLCRRPAFSPVGVSAAGGTAHNIGQCLAAMWVLTPESVCSYLPLLLIVGCLAGAVIGFVSELLVRRLKKLPL